MDEKIEVRSSRIQGKGVFATADIKRGERICLMRGERMTIPVLKRKYARGTERINDPLQIGDALYLDLDEPYVFINHSCAPNATMIGVSTLVALRNIRRGEEITYDYSLTTWGNDAAWGKRWAGVWWMRCRCGKKNCRGVVREFQRLPEKIRRKYFRNGTVQDFVLAKMAQEIKKIGFEKNKKRKNREKSIR
ncbi:MAG: SET domain-containing protein [Candidatus Diapherotrites archaeon]|nr:SET domain-containing protein [Candidatus Diapherotrites archaeon]